MRPPLRQLLIGPRAEARVAAAKAWLAKRPAAEPVLVLGATLGAARALLHQAGAESGTTFGRRALTLDLLAHALSGGRLAEERLAPIRGVGLWAACARATSGARPFGPGLARALAATAVELGLAGAAPKDLPPECAQLRSLYAGYRQELARLRLADPSDVYRAATGAVRGAPAHPFGAMPILLLDVPVAARLPEELLAALAERSPAVLATSPEGDERSRRALEAALGVEARGLAAEGGGRLARVQALLFDETRTLEPAPEDGEVELFSAPGESRECVEIARRILRLGERGLPFDRIAVILRQPALYRAHLAEALRRAGVPAYVARGAVRPDPSGRALLALCACAAEKLSAARFAEYLSLSMVPAPDPDGAPPPPPPEEDRLPPLHDAAAHQEEEEALEGEASDPEAPVSSGSLRAPRRWEQLLVDAAVVGGRDRWRRRLDGLEATLRSRLRALEDPEDPAAAALTRRLDDLSSLRRFALPLLDELAELPAEASWGTYLASLSRLASRAIRRPERVLEVLAELEPMAPVGPVTLSEVRELLAPRLTALLERPRGQAAGRVFVGSIEEARGRSFAAVFAPGLGERIFPAKVVEDPLLSDQSRAAAAVELAQSAERVAEERLALKLCAGAAERRLVLSYPRLDLEQGRPRVPSFYGLEILRAAEGRMPGFEELARRASEAGAARLRWPAPARPADAIDEAEYDLAVLRRLLHEPPERAVGAARYLLEANPHLARALRFRASRWQRTTWNSADGLVCERPGAQDALAGFALAQRAYSATALQAFAACPYRFYLGSILRLRPREVSEPLEELSPLERGELVHQTQRAALTELRERGLLPLGEESLEAASAVLDRVLDELAERYRETLAPAIERVWQDGITAIRRDLREWLARQAREAEWEPLYFELAFGLEERGERDPASDPAPADLDGGLRLRGAIDLVERRGDFLRATDHKTGAARADRDLVIGGGEVLQPVLYALALEKLFPGVPVASGRLYFCTDRGGFRVQEVPLDDRAREAVRRLAVILGRSLERGFFPAAPSEGACERCDYLAVCGPYEELRASRKAKETIRPLAELRRHP